MYNASFLLFFFSSRRRHTRWPRDWSTDVCSSEAQTGQTQWFIIHQQALVVIPGMKISGAIAQPKCHLMGSELVRGLLNHGRILGQTLQECALARCRERAGVGLANSGQRGV